MNKLKTAIIMAMAMVSNAALAYYENEYVYQAPKTPIKKKQTPIQDRPISVNTAYTRHAGNRKQRRANKRKG